MSISLLAFAAALAQDAPPPRTPNDPIDEAPESAWTEIAADDLMVMDVGGKRVVIQLNEAFAPTHVANVKNFARNGYWDGGSVYRVVDNWVTQWGNGGNPLYADENKPLPEGAVENPPADYARPAGSVNVTPLGSSDSFSSMAGFDNGWPVAVHDDGTVSPTYCYGYVGVARSADPDTGTGSELFAIIGTPARRLDRNYAVIGRVVDGMENLSAIPRGTDTMGVYAEGQAQIPIEVTMMDALPEDEQMRFKMMKEGSASFAEYVYLTSHNLHYGRGTSGSDICSVRVPVRKIEEEG
ncbi:peptidylprolyl isomerase [Sphingomicrobium clamense]|uniref:peptidylprolyl isomerase n=1 Tax=Sphingomicrobium clamense TaxID=2851013 RepID=A0ABS6V2J8_9SPHN|nr:peptidylprolyl isomerase [Sphingomicrobium sp. B8]MBW0143751.1 peptidylprolyl isomerase [Sphingomicrobium sp. B8]